MQLQALPAPAVEVEGLARQRARAGEFFWRWHLVLQSCSHTLEVNKLYYFVRPAGNCLKALHCSATRPSASTPKHFSCLWPPRGVKGTSHRSLLTFGWFFVLLVLPPETMTRKNRKSTHPITDKLTAEAPRSAFTHHFTAWWNLHGTRAPEPNL